MVRMQFPEWFARRVDRANERIDDLDLQVLSRGPNPVAFNYHGFNINGFAFRTVESETNKKVQNSGVMVQAMHDNDDHESIYYGRLTDVISLDYGGECEEHEPFILATQAQMVYYVRDPKEEDWYCAIRHTPRDTYNMGNEDDMDTMHFIHNNFSNMESILGDVNRVDVELIRTDVEGSIVDVLPVVNNETDDKSFS
ncbi:hypothetical protein ZIOFF_065808 [Zingiber officinale]|uniref:DUF4216 domain-containing protein n=1 Tax=Zingiber officinale TaxID=94328 RepID=A0A8J5KBQ1_ZINOF|nr:hypothetical protein ZIOFF_065808 [Zingiber officinale]